MSYFPLRGTKQFPLLQRSVKITYIFFPNTVENYHVVTPCEFSICYTIYPLIYTRFKYLKKIMRKLYSNSLSVSFLRLAATGTILADVVINLDIATIKWNG
jgi:hypothetical protein